MNASHRSNTAKLSSTPGGSIPIRSFACVVGLALVLYGVTGIWLSYASPVSPTKDKACASWLCPEEFSEDRSYALRQAAVRGDFTRTLIEFKRGVVLDPASAFRWADLGDTIDGHQVATARYCFNRALIAAPYSPAILFRAANFYFGRGDYANTMQYLSRVLRDPELTAYYDPAFLTYARMGVPVSEVVNKGIPPTRVAAQAFLRFLIQGRQIADAAVAWKWISDHSLGDDKIDGEYVGFLVQNHQEERAADTWQQLNSQSMPDYRHANWIFNGSFEAVPKPSPFDWHIETAEDVQAGRVDNVAHDKRWSLQLIFEGKTNVDYHQTFQQTVITPGKWRIRAVIKTDGITTDQGVSLRVLDPTQPQRLDIRTDPLTGTHDWTTVESIFDVARTMLVQVEVTRRASMKFDNKIQGEAWIDSVDLSPQH